MKTSFYTDSELRELGLKTFGKNVLISRNASFYNPENISLGDNVRIDDFCILSGKITLGSYVHISAFCALYGARQIIFEDFSGISARVTIYSAIDDFSGRHLTNSTVPEKYKQISGGPVCLKKYVQIGAHTVVLPDLNLEEGVAVGAMSLVNKSLPAWGIYAGIPASFLKDRQKNLLKLEKQLEGTL
ncbi:MAG: acyltransferase [Candidatus Margulisbacteria bacterium]|nr:acyltransferase [Candidatus Margulisiibacteriota bacterium]